MHFIKFMNRKDVNWEVSQDRPDVNDHDQILYKNVSHFEFDQMNVSRPN